MTGYESNADLKRQFRLKPPCKAFISIGRCDREIIPGTNGCIKGAHVTEAEHKATKASVKTVLKAAKMKRNEAAAAIEAKR